MMVGLAAEAVDFDKWPDMTPEKLEATGREVELELRDAGFEPKTCLIDGTENSDRQVTSALRAFQPDVLVIGGGVRLDPGRSPLLERVVNLFAKELPGVKFAFNTRPWDTVDAVRRVCG